MKNNDITEEKIKKNVRKIRTGTVISNKMDKTIIVKSVVPVPHPHFKKIIKKIKKFYVHDESNHAKVGDQVSVMETRPLSRLKRWRLLEIIKQK